MKTEIIRFEGGPADGQIVEYADPGDSIRLPQYRRAGPMAFDASGAKPPAYNDPSYIKLTEVRYERAEMGDDGAVIYRMAAE